MGFPTEPSCESFGFLASDHARPRVSPPLPGSLCTVTTALNEDSGWQWKGRGAYGKKEHAAPPF